MNRFIKILERIIDDAIAIVVVFFIGYVIYKVFGSMINPLDDNRKDVALAVIGLLSVVIGFLKYSNNKN